MLLAADVGNTEIVLGVFDGDTLRHTWRSSTRPERTSDELALLLSGFLEHRDLDLRSDVDGLCLASVVPDVTGQFREMAAAYLSHEPLVVGPGMKTGVTCRLRVSTRSTRAAGPPGRVKVPRVATTRVLRSGVSWRVSGWSPTSTSPTLRGFAPARL